VVLPEFGTPFGKLKSKLFKNLLSACHLDGMALAVVKSDRLDMFVAFERPRKASGGVLPTGEKDKCFRVHVPSAGETGLLYVFRRHEGFGDDGLGNYFRPEYILALGAVAL
jgi:hypothetical protein